MEKRGNSLAKEKSPYLLQHKDNPIAWFPWGAEAFEIARRENKPVFLSVGYSTCHWCHVMAHESFEDQEVADVLNDKFISIKVDREERPDVDDVYMKALQTLSGGGGWPMSVWLTPEGKPFFAGTYFPKYRFLQLLRRITELWGSEPAQLLEDGERLLAAIRDSENVEFAESSAADWEETLRSYISHFQFHYDENFGGFGQAPKFPQSMNLMLMMRQDFKTGLNQAEVMVTGTLANMVRGGIYDQLAGGFHRYSVDQKWRVPHFEKMLHDQALLTVTLIEASQAYGQTDLMRAARETLDYVAREMTHAQGGFFSAQDADSLNPQTGRKEEGYFATYSYDELKNILLEEELEVLKNTYGVTPQGDFEGRAILNLQEGVEPSQLDDPRLVRALSKLRELRASRPAPHLDDKIISAWNGWMIWAFALAGRTLSEPKYLKSAQRALGFIQEHMWNNGDLARFWRDGEAKGRATSEDYASVIHAALELHQADFDPRWVTFALDLQAGLDQKFWDSDEGAYFTNDGHDAFLPVRSKDDYDGVTPCSNSMAAFNLARLFLLTGELQYKQKSERIVEKLFPKFKQYPSGLPYLGLAIDALVSETKVAVLSGKDWAVELYHEQSAKFLPYSYWTSASSGWPVAKDKTGGEVRIYICEEGHCLKPASDKAEALKQLATN